MPGADWCLSVWVGLTAVARVSRFISGFSLIMGGNKRHRTLNDVFRSLLGPEQSEEAYHTRVRMRFESISLISCLIIHSL